MSYNSKKNIVSMAAGILSIVAYAVYNRLGSSPAPDDIKSWTILLLVFIGVGVAAQIIIQILFHIAFAIGVAVKERERDENKIERIISSSVIEDERDKLISLKSSHIGYICAGIGFAAGLISLAAGVSAVAALHIMAGAFAAGSLIEGGISIYFHERGVRNG